MTSTAHTAPTKQHRIILDCDPGIDDAMAILLALASPNIVVEALTIVHGNHNNVELLADNALKVLRLVNRTDIPIYIGAKDPMMRPFHSFGGVEFHGENGLGDVPLDEFPVLLSSSSSSSSSSSTTGGDVTNTSTTIAATAATAAAAQLSAPPTDSDTLIVPKTHTMSAATAIVRLCTENPGEITIVTIGPQTNLALALLMEPRLPLLAKQVCMMGGAFNGTGNVSPVAEANVHNDPEATRLVFRSFPDIVIAPLDVTHQIIMTSEDLERLKDAGHVGRFLSTISQCYLRAYINFGDPHIFVHDAAIVMYLIRPDLFESERLFVDVEVAGELTHGQTIAYRRGFSQKPAQATVLFKADNAKFLELYQEYIASLSAATYRQH